MKIIRQLLMFTSFAAGAGLYLLFASGAKKPARSPQLLGPASIDSLADPFPPVEASEDTISAMADIGIDLPAADVDQRSSGV